MGQITGNGTARTGLGGAAGYGETAMERADDGSLRLDLSAVFEQGFFVGGAIVPATDIFLSTDGLLSFGAAITGFQADPAGLATPFIAAFHADVDTRLDGEGAESGPVWIDLDPQEDAVTITWQDVGFYRRNATETNTFQLQLFDRSNGEFDVVLRYEDIGWVSGDLEGGWNGLGGTAAWIGTKLGTGAAVTLAASGNETALLALPQTIGNTGQTGLWVWQIRREVAIPGAGGDDRLTGSAGNDTIYGGAGNDVMTGGAGADLLDGGAGFDMADYGDSPQGLTVDLADPAANTGLAAGDSYVSVEGVSGSSGADDLRGDAGGNLLDGGGGADLLTGRGGNDTLLGGTGDDTLSGGGGADRMEGGEGIDTVTYAQATAAVRLDMASPSLGSGEAAGDVLIGVEIVLGSAFNDTLAGDGSANTFDGGAGSDLLQGRAGDDTLIGGAGNDTLEGGTGADLLNGGEGVDLASYDGAAAGLRADLATPSANTGEAAGDLFATIEGLIGSAFADTLGGDTGGNLLYGGAGNDLLQGRAGDDTLFGGAGNDTLEGGTGANRLDGGEGMDSVSYANATRGIRLDLLTPALNAGEAAGDVLISIEAVIGSAFADTVAGSDTADEMEGGAGDDLLTGRGGADRLFGGAGDDTLEGGAGNDTLDGGEGIDVASYANAAAAIKADLSGAVANTGEALGDTLLRIEGLIGSAFADDLRGDGGANRLWGGGGNDTLRGGAGNDTLTGGAGADSLDGGAGTDWASYAEAGTAVVVDLTTRTLNTGEAAGDIYTGIEGILGSAFNDRLLGSKITDLLAGGGGDDALFGRAGSDQLFGGDGNDTLDGGAGADRLDGGAGVDWVSYATSSKAVAADLAGLVAGSGDAAGDIFIGIEGLIGSAKNDTLMGALTASLLDGGAGNDILTGRGAEDSLFGGTGNDTLIGGAGADRLDGGAGTDWASYATAAAGVRVDLANPALGSGDAAGDVFLGIEAVLGSAFADTFAGDGAANLFDGGAGDDLISGRDGADTLRGGAGNDTLIGGAGADVLTGGAGTDWASYADAAAAVRVDLAKPASNLGDALGDILTEIEAILGSAFEDTLRGGAAADILSGGGANDVLFGSGGNDTLYGGSGNDILEGGGGADRLEGGDGYDWAVYSSSTKAVKVDLLTPSLNTGDAKGDIYVSIEGLRGGLGHDTLAGTAASDRIDGDAGNDSLLGREGSDTLWGGGGNDTLDGGSGADEFYGGDGADRLIGGAGNDTLWAGAGNDRLEGGEGDDLLMGGAGADQFLHSGTAAEGSDLVIDYSASQGDLLVYTGIGAQRSDFRVEIIRLPDIGSASQSEAQIVHLPTGRILWTLADGAGMTDIFLRIGNSNYDLV